MSTVRSAKVQVASDVPSDTKIDLISRGERDNNYESCCLTRRLSALNTILILLCLLSYQGFLFAQEEAAVDSAGPIIYAIEITGNRVTQPELILREMELKVGMHATTAALERSRLQIASLGLFNRVEMVLAEDEGRAVLQVQVTEPFYLYPYVNGRYDYNHPERAILGAGIYHYNFRGMGERLGASAWGGYSRGGTVFHDDPWFSIKGRYGIDTQIYYTDSEITDPLNQRVRRESYGIRTSLNRRLGLRHSLKMSLGWDQIESKSEDYTLTKGGMDRMASIVMIYKNDKRDYRYYPKSGYYILTLLEANRLVDMNHNFFREMLDLRSYQHIRNVIIACRAWGEFGQQELPFYRWLSVGSGLVRAGKSFSKPKGIILGGNIELRFPLIKPFYSSLEQIPLAGPYLRNMMFSLEGVLFADRGFFASVPLGVKNDFRAYGLGLQAQLPYIKIAHFLLGWTPAARFDEPLIIIRNGVTF